jgi:hypothetical protein
MSLSIRASYPKRIAIDAGSSVVIHSGVFDKDDHLVAHSIHDANRGITYQLHADEHPQVRPFGGNVKWKFPFVGQVLSCLQYGEYTHLEIHPTEQSLYEFSRMRAPETRAAVPAFWRLVNTYWFLT